MSVLDGAVLGATKIIDHGPDARRFNLVIIAEGYQAAEMAKFATDARRVADAFLAMPGIDIFRTAINVHRIDVTSTDSGADIPCGPAPVTARTFFDAAYCDGGLERLIRIDQALAMQTARARVPNDPHPLVLVNHPKYGGSGGASAVTSLNASALRIAIHEMGHSVFDLGDEYLEGKAGNPATDHWANRANLTTQKTPAGAPVVKWQDLVAAATPIPTTSNVGCATAFDANPVGAGVVGAFEGGGRFNCGVWRPQHRCIMGKDPNQPFCQVCRRRVIARLSPHAQQPTEIHRESWTLGWTTMNPFLLGGQTHLISYKLGSGSVSIDRARADGSGFDNTMGSTWSTGWTSLVPMATPVGQFLVLYKALTGQAEIDLISADGQDVTTVAPDTWGTGWTHMVAFQLAGQPHLLSYKVASGSVAIDRLNPDGTGFVNTMGSTWSTGWTSLVPMQVGARMLLLTYKAGTGEVQVSEITPDGQNVNMLSSDAWSTGWTGFAPFTVDGDTFYVGYKAGDGLMSVDRMRPDGTGVDTLLFRSWAPGWSLFAPMVLGGVPHELVYRATDGAAAIDKIF